MTTPTMCEHGVERRYIDCGACGDYAVTFRRQRYTVFVEWVFGTQRNLMVDDTESAVEEIDVDATNADNARVLAQEILDRDYNPGGRIFHVEGPRVGLYL